MRGREEGRRDGSYKRIIGNRRLRGRRGRAPDGDDNQFYKAAAAAAAAAAQKKEGVCSLRRVMKSTSHHGGGREQAKRKSQTPSVKPPSKLGIAVSETKTPNGIIFNLAPLWSFIETT